MTVGTAPSWSELAGRYGTPVHVLDLAKLADNASAFRRAWQRCVAPVDVYYSVKTNYLPLVCARLAADGWGADVVAGHELELALASGFEPSRIVFNGPMKTVDEIRRAVDLGIRVNVDSPADITLLEKFASSERVGVGLRVHPGHNVYRSDDAAYAQAAEWRAARSKFGWALGDPATDALTARVAASDSLELRGVHCHLGSQITDEAAFLDALRPVMAFTARMRRDHPIDSLNIGGGFGVPGIDRPRVSSAAPAEASALRRPGRSFDMEHFVAGVNDLLDEHSLTDLRLACEPGRYVVSDAMVLLSTVVGVKRQALGAWAVLDGGLNLLPTAGVGEVRAMTVVGEARPAAPYFVGGPLCYEGDVLSYRALLPEDLSEGELVVLHDTGAYSVSRATNFIRPRAGVVAVHGDRHELCWRPESYDDIFSFHCTTSFEPTAR
ncbi:MAG TPA: hypothetical protein VM938_08140 [Acidimicrobiales bacterium]|nr:hypothetical protein [Acidimicrobiales bacterium]